MSPSSESTCSESTTSSTIDVTLPANLHARPAGQLAQLAAGFDSSVHLEFAGRSVSPTGILSVMSLGARAGSTLTIRVEGPDADRAISELALFLADIT